MDAVSNPKMKAVTSGMGLAAAYVSEMILPLVRSVALARLIAPDQFGLAISLSVAASMAVVLLDFGIHQSAVRSEREGHPESAVLATLHVVQLIRGAVVGVLLLIFGPLLASLVNAPEAGWAFMMLGLSAFIHEGFGNLGVKRLMRDYRFWPEAITISGEQIAWTIVTVWTAFYFDDYRCMLAGIFASAIYHAISTQFLSPTPWRLGWTPSIARQIINFGTPLVPNGMALSVTLYGDRVLVGSYLGLTALAQYSTAFMAAVLPRGVLLKMMQAIALPIFVNARERGAAMTPYCDAWTLLLTSTAFFYGLGFMCFGQPAIAFVFGAAYSPEQTFVSLIGVSVCVKFLLSLPTPPALAAGRTRFVVAGTVASAAALGPAAIAVVVAPSLNAFVLSIALGELTALILIVHRTVRAFSFSAGLTWFLCGSTVGILAGFAVFFRTVGELGLFERLIPLGVGVVLFGGVVLLASLIAGLDLREALKRMR